MSDYPTEFQFETEYRFGDQFADDAYVCEMGLIAPDEAVPLFLGDALIGDVQFTRNAEGLYGTGRVNTECIQGKIAAEVMAKGYGQEFSVAFNHSGKVVSGSICGIKRPASPTKAERAEEFRKRFTGPQSGLVLPDMGEKLGALFDRPAIDRDAEPPLVPVDLVLDMHGRGGEVIASGSVRVMVTPDQVDELRSSEARLKSINYTHRLPTRIHRIDQTVKIDFGDGPSEGEDGD